jgi:hypothetical protein
VNKEASPAVEKMGRFTVTRFSLPLSPEQQRPPESAGQETRLEALAMNVSGEAIQNARDSLRRYEEQTEQYGEQPEQWKQDHEAAMRCLDFEGLLAYGLSVFDFINRIDEAWRIKVYRNLVPYKPEVDKLIDELYHWWLRPCDRVMAQLVALEKHFDVEGGKEFRSACREVQGILTRDEDFFRHGRLTQLRDEAVDANRRGEAEEMRSMGD